MPTYEYECSECGGRFERRQAISNAPVSNCPDCGGKVRRLISGGAGLLVKGGGRARGANGCSFEASGTTSCGRNGPCGKPCGGAG